MGSNFDEFIGSYCKALLESKIQRSANVTVDLMGAVIEELVMKFMSILRSRPFLYQAKETSDQTRHNVNKNRFSTVHI